MSSNSVARGESDFSATRRMLVLAGFAVVIGGIGAVLALALLKLISLFTNIFYFQQFSIPMYPRPITPWDGGRCSYRLPVDSFLA